MRITSLAVLALSLAASAGAQVGAVDPQVAKIVSEISKDRIGDTLKKLESFGTRATMSDTSSPTRGTGAARKWIYDQFKSFSPRLEVRYDTFKVKGDPKDRIFRDVDVTNIVAVLPGTVYPERHIIVSGHYDSLATVRKQGATPGGDDTTAATDWEASAKVDAPGVVDDGSGTAVVLELARVLSQYKFDKTLVFVAFDAEEMGLVGSRLYAYRAKREGELIEALLNNDIVGSDVTQTGRTISTYVHVFSEEPSDSGPRTVARYVRETAQRYVPGFRAEPVFRADRFSRGGDHTPFADIGFPAVRITTPAENLPTQHTKNDTLDKADFAYTADVARVNAAAAASLALAPPPPEVNREITTGANKGRKTPDLARGKNQSDAVMKWKGEDKAGDLAGYAVMMRSTTAPYWEQQIFVGNVNEYTLPGINIDAVVLGIKAVDKTGNESLVSPYISMPAPRGGVKLQDGTTSTPQN